MSVQLVNDARRIAFYMEDDLHGIKQLAQAIFLIAEQIEYERCESILRIAQHHDGFGQHPIPGVTILFSAPNFCFPKPPPRPASDLLKIRHFLLHKFKVATIALPWRDMSLC